MTDIRNLGDLVKRFFVLYDFFIQVDIKLSLTKHGKELEFIKKAMIFYISSLTNAKHSKEQKEKKFLDFYNNLETYIIRCEKKYNFSVISNIPKFQFLKQNNHQHDKILKQYSEAIVSFINFRNSLNTQQKMEIAKKNILNRLRYYFNFKDKSLIDSLMQKVFINEALNIPKQALIEFHNFMSHLCAFYNNPQEDKNRERAVNHLYRGALDIYKIIIKDYCIIYTLDLDNENILKHLFNIRDKEYKNLGKKSLDNTQIIDEYKNFIINNVKN